MSERAGDALAITALLLWGVLTAPFAAVRWVRNRLRRPKPERVVVVGGASRVAARRALDALGLGYVLERALDDPCDWVATWPDGQCTRVLVP